MELWHFLVEANAFLVWLSEVGSKKEQNPIETHSKVPNFSAKLNMFTAQKKLTTVWGLNFM